MSTTWIMASADRTKIGKRVNMDHSITKLPTVGPRNTPDCPLQAERTLPKGHKRAPAMPRIIVAARFSGLLQRVDVILKLLTVEGKVTPCPNTWDGVLLLQS